MGSKEGLVVDGEEVEVVDGTAEVVDTMAVVDSTAEVDSTTLVEEALDRRVEVTKPEVGVAMMVLLLPSGPRAEEEEGNTDEQRLRVRRASMPAVRKPRVLSTVKNERGCILDREQRVNE